jgi:hypothetical protein
MQKYLHAQKKRRILEQSAAVNLIYPIKEKTMKIIRACLLLVALSCPIFAGDIPFGVSAADNIPNNVAAADDIPNGVAAMDDIPYGIGLLNLVLILL